MRISDWSSDVCSSDLRLGKPARAHIVQTCRQRQPSQRASCAVDARCAHSYRPPSVFGGDREHIMDQASREAALRRIEAGLDRLAAFVGGLPHGGVEADMVSREAHETVLAAHQLLRRLEEHTSELQSPRRNSLTVFWFTKQKLNKTK